MLHVLACHCSFSDLSTAMSDHHEVCQSLENLGSPSVQRRLGGALGLLYPTLRKMTSFPDQMVAAWLNRQDEVLERTGEPTWSTLANALREIGQTGVAEDILNHYGSSDKNRGQQTMALKPAEQESTKENG